MFQMATVCINGCKRDGFVCLDSCPCHPGCPLGCENCDSWVCEDTPNEDTPNDTLLVINSRERYEMTMIDLSGERILNLDKLSIL